MQLSFGNMARQYSSAESKQSQEVDKVKEPIVHTQLRLPHSLHKRLRRMGFDKEQPLQAIAAAAIDRYLAENGY